MRVKEISSPWNLHWGMFEILLLRRRLISSLWSDERRWVPRHFKQKNPTTEGTTTLRSHCLSLTEKENDCWERKRKKMTEFLLHKRKKIAVAEKEKKKKERKWAESTSACSWNEFLTCMFGGCWCLHFPLLFSADKHVIAALTGKRIIIQSA